jgi:signal transduction histidine kinase
MFYRANVDSDGSGLGLFIVNEAVERLGGKISLDSKVKGGSSFELEFPN